MKFVNLLKGELRFIAKYGIVFLYLILTVFYTVLLSVMPANTKHMTAVILIFTDPAAMGLFFMGAVMLLEKSQRIHYSLAVSPITINEYIGAKVLTMLMLGTIVSLAIGFFTNLNLTWIAISVMLSSALFSLCALIVSTKTQSLNSFLIVSAPFEIVICVPALLYLFGVLKSNIWLLHPGVAAIALLQGNLDLWWFCAASLLLWNSIAFLVCREAVKTYFIRMGGEKL